MTDSSTSESLLNGPADSLVSFCVLVRFKGRADTVVGDGELLCRSGLVGIKARRGDLRFSSSSSVAGVSLVCCLARPSSLCVTSFRFEFVSSANSFPSSELFSVSSSIPWSKAQLFSGSRVLVYDAGIVVLLVA